MVQAALDRPDPDALLARVTRDEREAARGALRIYFGASAGVGKTYAMLLAARNLKAEGRDVAVGIVETHGRSETAALLSGSLPGGTIEAIPLAQISDNGRTLAEFDLDAALARKPELMLVDELAHTNAPGSRHAKRWQDVDELLSAGIDVFTTLNVQHLESLNDIVGGITGIRVWETVPDTFFDSADEVILVDISADELLKRLSAGKVYLPEQAERAAKNFFRKGNLIALREIALRRTADRVEDDVQAYRTDQAIATVWKTEASLLCCVGPEAGSERVVRSAARLANQIDVGWRAVYVETPALQKIAETERVRILAVVRMAQELGATTTILSGSDSAAVLADYARNHNISKIVLGRSLRPNGVARLFSTTMAEQLAMRAPEIDLIAIGGGGPRVDADGTARPGAEPTRSEARADGADAAKSGRLRMKYAYAGLACVVVTSAATVLLPVLHLTNIAMLYLLAVTLVAVRFGRGPAVFAAFVSVAAYDFFFVPPRFSFAVSDLQYLVTFAVMLAVALVIGTLTANLRYQARVATHREERARALYEFARDLSSALRSEDVASQAIEVLGRVFRADVRLLLPAASGHDRLVIPLDLSRSPGFEPAIAHWAHDHARAAGAGTDTLSGSPWLFLPLVTPMRSRGVLAIKAERQRTLMSPEQRRLLETFATLVSIALERVHYVSVAQGAVVKVESERLRNSILSALSHDLRTPLAALGGLADTLALEGPTLDDAQRELVDAMRDEAQRMNALVENLLDMARIESGDVKLNRQWQPIEEVVGSALASMRGQFAKHRVEVALPKDLPLVEFDAVLIERVLVNLLGNAAKHAPSGTVVRIDARVEEAYIAVGVEDDGPGLPIGYESAARIETLFDKFTRGQKESPRTGVGLGLAICRAIVSAHGGSIGVARHADREPSAASNDRGPGVRFVFTLPLGGPPEVDAELIPLVRPA